MSKIVDVIKLDDYLKWDGVAGSNKFYLGTAVRSSTASLPVYTATTFNINSSMELPQEVVFFFMLLIFPTSIAFTFLK